MVSNIIGFFAALAVAVGCRERKIKETVDGIKATQVLVPSSEGRGEGFFSRNVCVHLSASEVMAVSPNLFRYRQVNPKMTILIVQIFLFIGLNFFNRVKLKKEP